MEKMLPTNDQNINTLYNNIFKNVVYVCESIENVAFEEHRYQLISSMHNKIGTAYSRQGQYDKALEYFFSALNNANEVTNRKKPFYWIAVIHGNIGAVYLKIEKNEKALEHLLYALKIGEDSLLADKENTAIIALYSNIGIIYKRMGLYEKSLVYYFFALQIGENIEIRKKPLKGELFHNIGTTYCAMGQYEKALEYFFLALEKALTLNYAQGIATIYNSIGEAYRNMSLVTQDISQYEKAFEYHLNAFEMTKKSFPADSLEMSVSHNNIGEIFRNAGQYEKALEHHFCALSINEKCLPKDSPSIAISHNNIGCDYLNLGQYEKALIHSTIALEINKKSLPKNHLYVVQSLGLVINNYYNLGDKEKTLDYTYTLMGLLPSVYQGILSIFNEMTRVHMLRFMNVLLYLHHIVSLTYRGSVKAADSYNILLQSKDLNSEAEWVLRAYTTSAHYPDYAEQIKELREKQADLQHPDMNAPGKEEQRKDLEKDIQSMELLLAPHVPELKFKWYMMEMTTKKILEKLSPGQALIEYGWFYYKNSAADTRPDNKSGGKYYAYLLRDDEIILHYLEADEIIHTVLRSAREKITSTDKNEKPGSDNADNELSTLYQLLIAPFIDKLSGIEHLFIAPDGELYKLPFELLVDEKGKALADPERFSISYLSSGRGLVRSVFPGSDSKSTSGYNSAAILADPLFYVPDGMLQKSENNDYIDLLAEERSIIRQSRDSGEEVSELFFAKAEAEALNRMFKGKIKKAYYRENAKKSTLEELSKVVSPNIIHIVTHGFAHEKQKLPEAIFESIDLENLPMNAPIENPLVRCGLVFSGYNNRVRNKVSLEEYGDGILNAKEVLRFNLPDTDLIVLSACQTGLGDTNNGEGIQGLRSSFELIGVRSLICTLWEVDDLSSAILMEQFYKNLLEKNMNKLDALVKAKDYVKTMDNHDRYEFCENNGFMDWADQIGSMAASDNPYEHPYYWAGYILQGDI